MEKEKLLQIEDKLNRKYSFILEKIGADIIVEEDNLFDTVFYLDFPKCRMHFPTQEDLEKILYYNTSNFNLFN